MITAAQLRAARGLLDWTRSDLAKAANISPETIKNIEHGTFRPQETTADAIVRAFAAHGVEFTADEGVRHSNNKIFSYKGAQGFREFFDDVYAAALQPEAGEDGTKPICISNVDDRYFIKNLPKDFALMHAQRMSNLKHNVIVKILLKDAAQLNIPGTHYREYRLQSGRSDGNVPFYVYGDRLAIMIFEDNKEPQIIVIESPPVARAYRDQFNVLWKSAQKVELGQTASVGV